MTETRELLIYGKPDMNKIRDAKQALGVPFLVVPRFLTNNYDSGWGLDRRVLAYDATPPFLCDYALIGPKTSQEGLLAALKWVLLGGDDPRVTHVFETLSKWMGTEITELTTEEVSDYDRTEKLNKVSFRLKLNERGDSYDR